MALHIVDDVGRYFNASQRRIPKQVKEIIASFKKADLEEIYNFINEQTADGKIFCVATKFGQQKMSWEGTPLIKIWDMCRKNYTLSASILGHLAMNALGVCDQEWTCSKTPITKQDFEVNSFYTLDSCRKVS